MQLAQPGQVHEFRVRPVQHLQQHEVRHIRHTALPWRTYALGDVAGPLLHQASHFADEPLQARG